MSNSSIPDVPQTLEGYYVLHDVYRIDWPKWWRAQEKAGYEITDAAGLWLKQALSSDQGDTAAYSILGQKGDLMLVHYRRTPEELSRAEMSFRRLELFEYLQPVYSYVSVIELSMYELTAVVARKVAEAGLKPGTSEYEAEFAAEMERQKPRVQSRLFPRIPAHKYVCYYPMNKRRGEQVNWYSLPSDQRRELMRSHGRVGHKYHETVTQIIGGSTGLDDWEWGVNLHSDDLLAFKKLVYEMRFDPASALYAEFGPFYIGLRIPSENLPQYLAGKWP